MSQVVARHDDGDIGGSNVFSQLAQVAKDPSVDAGKLKIIYDLMKDYKEEERKEKAEKARVDFYAALAEMQGHLPIIKRDTQNPNTRSRFAQLSTLWAQCLPIWTKYGFAVSFDSRTLENNLIEVSLKLSHKTGHTEIFHTPSAPPDTSGLRGVANKTFVQGNQSTITYLQRGLLCRALGIVTANFDDDDDDGAGGAAPTTVVQRRGRDMPPVGRDDPIVAEPSWLDPLEEKNPGKWFLNFCDLVDEARTEAQMLDIGAHYTVQSAEKSAPAETRRKIREKLIDGMMRVKETAENDAGGPAWEPPEDGPERPEGTPA